MARGPAAHRIPPDREVIALRGSHRQPVPGAHVVGRADPLERIDVSLLLRSRFSGRRLERVEAVGSRPLARRNHIGREEFESRHAAGPNDIAQVERFAQRHQLDLVAADPARRTVGLSGRVSDMERAFGVDLARWSVDGSEYRGRTGPIHIPAELGAVVQSVFGLDNRAQAIARYRQSGPASRKRSGSASPTLTPADLGVLYEFPHEFDGRGQTIALVELGGGYRMPDVTDYFRALGESVPTVLAVSVDGAHNAPDGQRHGSDNLVMLDLAIAAVLAPAAKIVIYFAPNTARGFVDAVSTAVHDRLHRPTILSISWGAPEKTWAHQAMRAVDEAFQEAALLGVTVLVASGDDGARGQLDDGLAHVDFPASSPHALACGGTRIKHSPNGSVSEAAWGTRRAGATGGGVSDIFRLPSWQANGRVPSSVNPGHRIGRGVPDVAAHADPATGYRVWAAGQRPLLGGTGAAASMWAALVARLNQRIGHPVGYLNPLLYRVSHDTDGRAFRDVASGTNGMYDAQPGWDATTGLGSPRAKGLIEALANAGVAHANAARTSVARVRFAPNSSAPDALPVTEVVNELRGRPPVLTGAATILNTERSRRGLIAAIGEGLWDGESLRLAACDVGVDGMTLNVATDVGTPILDVEFESDPDLSGLSHPLASLLPVMGADHCLVSTRACAGSRFVYLNGDLVGPRIAQHRGRRPSLLNYLGRVIDPEAGTDPLRLRYVEPGVGRSYLVDFLRIRGRSDIHDFSVTGAGLTPFSKDGFFFRGPHIDGHMPLMRALHRQRLGEVLGEAGCRVPAVAAIVAAPELEHTMPDRSRLPGALLVRGFRTVLRVKQLDPLANPLMSSPALPGLQRLLAQGEWETDGRLRGAEPPEGEPDPSDAVCTCLIPSYFLGTRPGRRCADNASCRRQRIRVLHSYAPSLLEVATARLSEERSRDPDLERIDYEGYAHWFAETMGTQLAAMRSVRFLHDYRAAQTEWHDPYDLVNSLTDTNVTLLAELADLDTGVLVDRGEFEWLEALRLSRDAWEVLRADYDALHETEVRLARAVVETVAIASRTQPRSASEVFHKAYDHGCARHTFSFATPTRRQPDDHGSRPEPSR